VAISTALSFKADCPASRCDFITQTDNAPAHQLLAKSGNAWQSYFLFYRFSYRFSVSNLYPPFVSGGLTELYQVWAVHRPIIGAPRIRSSF